jgi:hypothetical protein
MSEKIYYLDTVTSKLVFCKLLCHRPAICWQTNSIINKLTLDTLGKQDWCCPTINRSPEVWELSSWLSLLTWFFWNKVHNGPYLFGQFLEYILFYFVILTHHILTMTTFAPIFLEWTQKFRSTVGHDVWQNKNGNSEDVSTNCAVRMTWPVNLHWNGKRIQWRIISDIKLRRMGGVP